ncbi:MAG: DNA-processing protein DprA [Thiohalocapsa sp.]|uniref:DNA-processing protein DprA n=1 Tax=Thiohalocapsa sp. TaxID=2497641 RepID=UPI0025DD3AA5|nr:DNA-processing protein DprA [Thiohalocapsa sp.]MCG6941794.1 DNA-processing protein DprA [Thiohalocapsa sp.]
MKPAERERLTHWLALALAPGVGPRRIAQLLERFGGAAEVREAGRAALSDAGLSNAAINAIGAPDRDKLEATFTWLAHAGTQLLTPDTAGYPRLLREIGGPPPLLFVRGDTALLNEPQIGIVGSRNPTAGGLETARDFAGYLAGLGLVVTSGLALGIDAAAHEGALAGGRTIAVLGTGPDRVYPAAHRDLARRIADNGALVSELIPGTGPHASNFPQRNRIISGLSLGTLVVEAAVGSGSLITARLASEQGREVFAVPGSIHNPLARGCHALIRQGAKLVDSATQILEELGAQLGEYLDEAGDSAIPVEPDRPDTTELDADHHRLLACMGYDPLAPDDLIARTGLPAFEIASMLLLLELQGHVVSHPGGRYSLRGGRQTTERMEPGQS